MRPITANKYLTDVERDKLLVTLSRHPCRDSLLLQLILYTGARGCEVLALRPEDFAFEGMLCKVNIKGAKGSNDRTVPLPRKFSIELREYLVSHSGSKPFDITSRQLRYIWDQYRPTSTKGIHCLRHTAAILLYLNCRDILIVRSFLGHKSVTNTQVYLDFVLGVRELKKQMRGMWGQRIEDIS